MATDQIRDHEFRSMGVGVRSGQSPLSVMVHHAVDAHVRGLPKKSEWLRSAIMEKLEREGYQLRGDSLVHSQSDAP